MALLKLPAHRLTGNYTPDLVVDVNVDSVTLLNAFYAVTGQFVQVYIAAQIDPTAAGFVSFTASLPFGMDVIAESDCIGTAGTKGSPTVGGTVAGLVSANTVHITAQLNSTAPAAVFFHFAYILNT
jgi:hypothetical protein